MKRFPLAILALCLALPVFPQVVTCSASVWLGTGEPPIQVLGCSPAASSPLTWAGATDTWADYTDTWAEI